MKKSFQQLYIPEETSVEGHFFYEWAKVQEKEIVDKLFLLSKCETKSIYLQTSTGFWRLRSSNQWILYCKVCVQRCKKGIEYVDH